MKKLIFTLSMSVFTLNLFAQTYPTTVVLNGDPSLLLFNTDRPWIFQQINTEANTELDLHSTFSNKKLKITSPNNNRAAQFLVSDDASNNKVLLVPDGGKVGIGTTTSSDPLEVKGNIIRITDGTNDNLWNRLVTNSDGTFSIKNPSGVNHLVINGNQIGIGTNTPSSKLDIRGLGDGTELLRFTTERPWVFRQTSTAGSAQLDLHSTVSDKNFKITSMNNNRAAQFLVSDNASSNRVLLVPDGGRVGIGTTTFGNHTLAVEGSIGAREIKVEANGWSDFVFENNYNLRTLNEVEDYIVKNKHLPEIPSEEEVNVNGINLGKMDAKLLQKIEELTLYLIQQNKRLDAQQKEIMALKAQSNN